MLKVKTEKRKTNDLNTNRAEEIHAEGFTRRNIYAMGAICLVVLMYVIVIYMVKDSEHFDKLLSNFNTVVLSSITAIAGFVAGRELSGGRQN